MCLTGTTLVGPARLYLRLPLPLSIVCGPPLRIRDASVDFMKDILATIVVAKDEGIVGKGPRLLIFRYQSRY